MCGLYNIYRGMQQEGFRVENPLGKYILLHRN